jgi:ATP-dependent DNA helicase RecG
LADKQSQTGNTLAGRLARLGLKGDADFVLHLPLRYEDETCISPLAHARPGIAAQFEVEVVSSEIAYRPRRQLLARVRDGSGALSLRFLNFYPSQQKVLQPGARLRIFGEVHEGYLGPEIIHPRFHQVSPGESLPEVLTPVYPTTAGLGQATLRRLIEKALARFDFGDTLPPYLLQRFGLPGFAEAIHFLHNPPPEITQAALEARDFPAWRRMQFDELLAQQLSLRRAYLARRARGAPQLEPTARLTDALLRSLPFRLTGAQNRAWAEIAADLGQPHPMQRLLQGDVGSGKTVVAALAMLHAVEAGHQAALMAPTEILAEQHYRKLAAWLQPLGIDVAWLTGSLKKRDKDAAIGRKSRRWRDGDRDRHPRPDRGQGRIRPPWPRHRR